MGIMRQIAEYLYIRKKDPTKPDFHFTIYAVQLYHCSMDPELAGT